MAEWLNNATLVIVPKDFREIELEENVIPVYDVPSNKRQAEVYKHLIDTKNYPYHIFCNTKANSISRARGMKEYIRKH